MSVALCTRRCAPGAEDPDCPVHSPYAQGAADERSRLVWWLRAAADGPAAVNMTEAEIQQIKDLADTIEQHPERFAQAPTTEGNPPADPEPVVAWVDRHGDVWTPGDDGLLHTPETAAFPRAYVERKWGPLRPAADWHVDGIGLPSEARAIIAEQQEQGGGAVHMRITNGKGSHRAACGDGGLGEWFSGIPHEVTCQVCREQMLTVAARVLAAGGDDNVTVAELRRSGWAE